MKRPAPPSNSNSGSRSSSRRYSYQKVVDNRKHPIRGLWRRHGKFYARLTVEEDDGRKKIQWAPLEAATAADAQAKFRTLLVERQDNNLRQLTRSPLFTDYLNKTYLPLLATSGKKPATLVTENTHYKRWDKALGHLRLDKIRASHVTGALDKLRQSRSARTTNLALVCLRHVLKAAKRDRHIKVLPVEDIAWQRTETKARRVYTQAEIESVIKAGRKISKNGKQFADYMRFLVCTGAREQESLYTRWEDIDWDNKILTIAAGGEAKNRRARRVDFNPALESLLKDMLTRRAPDSKWLFPSPQRGKKDIHSRTFRESLKLARAAAKLDKFGFHDCRHFFISMAVMAGIDNMTIARWVGHRDGGVLIGKVYGHLTDEHTQRQAQKLVLTPTGTPGNLETNAPTSADPSAAKISNPDKAPRAK
ncbi:MAG: site-specific integrase [Verrucomicrobiota bacterium]